MLHFIPDVFRIGETIPPFHNTVLSFTHIQRQTPYPLQNLTNKPGGFLKQVLLCGLGAG